MAYDGRANLIPAKKGEVRNPHGRPKKLGKALYSIPKDAQEKIYGILHHALKMPSVHEAAKYIDKMYDPDMEYGMVLQIASKALLGKNGWEALNDIMDRLFGKPRQTLDNNIHTEDAGLLISFKKDDAEG